jgi:hypothetical protein
MNDGWFYSEEHTAASFDSGRNILLFQFRHFFPKLKRLLPSISCRECGDPHYSTVLIHEATHVLLHCTVPSGIYRLWVYQPHHCFWCPSLIFGISLSPLFSVEQQARGSFAFTEEYVRSVLSNPSDYAEVRQTYPPVRTNTNAMNIPMR